MVEEVGQSLHDFIKIEGGSTNLSPYLGRQPLICKRNQEIAIAKLKAKKAKRKNGKLMPTFE